MKTTASVGSPIACTREAGAFTERVQWIAALNQAALLKARREGSRLILTYRRDHAGRVGELVRRERQCCGFLGFDVTEDQGGVTLVIEALQGAVDGLDTIFEPFLLASSQREGCAAATEPSRTGEENDGS